jgi:DNA polymerase III delta prime subunit
VFAGRDPTPPLLGCWLNGNCAIFTRVARIFISYKHVEPDQSLADDLASAIAKRHTVFIDTQIPLGKVWGDVIEEELGSADFLTALVSEHSAKSPMVVAEIAEAHRLNVEQKRPNIIPIRVKFDGKLRYPLSAYVNRFQQASWSEPADTPRITELVFSTLESSPQKHRPAAQRQQMIARVREDWVHGVLEKSLYQVARIDLGLEAHSGAVERGIDALIQRPEESPQPLPAGTRLIAAFDDQLGQLLILGAPGSGKTTLLLELARDLLRRAEEDEDHPIPVVFNLSSWAQHPMPLEKWMAEELRSRSDVPRKLAQGWVEKEQILPLLDGLDEVAENRRQECVEAINNYRAEHGFVQIVVCSRIGEYESLTTKLRLPAAIVVQPLSRAQVEEYLDRAGRPLEAVRGALQADAGMWELLSTPLMLSVVALAYKDSPVESLRATESSLVVKREQVFAAYLSQMFKRRTKETNFTEEQLRNWLSWMASRMVAQAQTTFQIEDIRSRWIGRHSYQYVAAVIVISLVTVMSGGLALANYGIIDYFSSGHTFPESLADKDALILAGALALFGTVLAVIRSRSAMPTEVLRLRWPGARPFLTTVAKWAALGWALGSILGTAGCAISDPELNWNFLLNMGVSFGTSGAATFALLGAIASLIVARAAGVRSAPTLAVDRSLRSSALCFLTSLILSLPLVYLLKDKNPNNEILADLVFGACLLPWLAFFIALEREATFF